MAMQGDEGNGGEQSLEDGMTRRSLLGRGAAGLAAGALGAAALGRAAAQDATPVASPIPPESGGRATPAQVAAAVAGLDGVIHDVMQRTGIPGIAAAVVYQDAVVYEQGFGVRKLGAPETIDVDTIFMLASVSKSMASTVVAAIVGAGATTWDATIVASFPEFALSDPFVTSAVTIRDMFCHRSGLPDHAGDLAEDIGYDRAEVLRRLRFVHPASSFRSAYAYTNFGLTAGAEAAARAAGMTWEDASDHFLYLPLGMTRTTSRNRDFVARDNRAFGHAKTANGWQAGEQRQPDAQSPAGGVYSTIRDMTRWLRLQLNGGAFEGTQIVPAAPLAATHVPQIVNNPPADPAVDRAGFYGLGWNVSYDEDGHPRWSHSGAFALGAATTVFVAPVDQLGIVVLANAAPIGAAETIAVTFLDMARYGAARQDYLPLFMARFAAMGVSPYAGNIDYGKPPTNAAPPLAPAAYAGAYANDLYGPATVIAEGSGLTLQLGPGPTTFPLTHYDRDVFFFQPPGENAFGPSGAIFDVGPAGAAQRLTIEWLDVTGQGTFRRTT
ncbi:MAG TPA: serine hydrolase [Thermomicrobiales bacterium]|nr:serine hydrolase [Thermomicrobiales bacterium]